MFKKLPKDYGGSLRKTRKGRAGARPISTRHTMHLVLKSSKAKGEWNFLRRANKKSIRRIIDKFAFVYGVKVVSFANAWNHLHLQIRLLNRFAYRPFIRAITGSIAMAVTGRSRWKKATEASQMTEALKASSDTKDRYNSQMNGKFWDDRPFTRVVESYKEYLILKDYIRMNEIEASGWQRKAARSMVQVEKRLANSG